MPFCFIYFIFIKLLSVMHLLSQSNFLFVNSVHQQKQQGNVS